MYNLVPRAFAQKPWVRCWSNNGIQSVHCASKWRVLRRDRLQCWTITCSCTWIRIWISKYSTLQSLFEFAKSCLKEICFRTIDSLKIRKYNPWSLSFFIFARKISFFLYIWEKRRQNMLGQKLFIASSIVAISKTQVKWLNSSIIWNAYI